MELKTDGSSWKSMAQRLTKPQGALKKPFNEIAPAEANFQGNLKDKCKNISLPNSQRSSFMLTYRQLLADSFLRPGYLASVVSCWLSKLVLCAARGDAESGIVESRKQQYRHNQQDNAFNSTVVRPHE